MTKYIMIFYAGQIGIPLADDPFFQMVKNNWTIREMLIKPNEEFSVEKVIEKALRQDVGPDPTLAMNKQNYQYADRVSNMGQMWEYKKKYRDKDPVLNPEAYFYDYKNLERRQTKINYECNFFYKDYQRKNQQHLLIGLCQGVS